MGDSAYLLVSPVRNEVGQIADLANAVLAQEHPPALWVFVDDGSTDGTSAALRRLAQSYAWVVVVSAPRADPGPQPSRYSELVALGFQSAGEVAEAEGLDYDYIANLDADVVPHGDLLARMIQRCDDDRMIGIASCRLVGPHRGRPLHGEGVPTGLRVWRRACAEQVAFYPTPHFGPVTALRARNRGWKPVVFEDLQATTIREPAARRGWWRGYRQVGQAAWYVGQHPLTVAVDAVTACVDHRDPRGVALVAGYIEAAVLKRRRTHDPEVRTYFGDDLPRETFGRWLSRLRPGRARRR